MSGNRVNSSFERREFKRYEQIASTPGEGLLVLTVLGSGLIGIIFSSVYVAFTCLFLGFAFILWSARQSILESVAGMALKAVESKNKDEVTASASSEEFTKPSKVTVSVSSENLLSLIKSRRSVFPKDFNGKIVSKEDISTMLEAANWAPTHGKTEPWRFVVLEGGSKEQLVDLTITVCEKQLEGEQLTKTIDKLKAKKAKDLEKVSAYIAICMKRAAKPEKVMPEWEEAAAVACAVQNMSLQAHALGVAGYWTSWQEVARVSSDMRAFLGLGDEDVCMGFFVTGLSDRAGGYRGARGPWEDKVEWKS